MKAINRLYKYFDYKNIKPTRFEKEIGLSNGYLGQQLKRNADLGESIIVKILNYCLDLNEIWFVTGKGDMLINTQIQKSQNCMLCYEKDKVINAQKETIALLKEKVENLNFRLQKNEGENFGHVSIAAEPKLKYKHTKK